MELRTKVKTFKTKFSDGFFFFFLTENKTKIEKIKLEIVSDFSDSLFFSLLLEATRLEFLVDILLTFSFR
jgi:hypothetical protein